MTHIFQHPKYYKELRKRNKLDQAISDEASTEATSVRPGPGNKLDVPAPAGPGLKQQASSDSQVVNQVKLSSQSQASSDKHQAPSAEAQAEAISTSGCIK